MTAPLNIQPNPGAQGNGVASFDAAGNETINGNLILNNGVVVLGKVAAAPGQIPGAVQIYTTDGVTLSYVAAGGQNVNQVITGNVTVNGNEFVGTTLTVGRTTPAGDNGVREIALAYATTVPTTNPSGSVVIYAQNRGLFLRDFNGTVSTLISGPQTSATTAGAIAETMHVYTASASQSPVSGTLYIQKVYIPSGITVSNISFVTSTTAANTPTHWWVAILDNTYTQVAHSADQLATAIPASTWQTVPLTTPYLTMRTGAYYLAFMIATSVAQPTLACATTSPLTVFVTGTGAPTPLPNGASTSGLTAPGTDGSTVYAAPTATSAPYYLYAS